MRPITNRVNNEGRRFPSERMAWSGKGLNRDAAAADKALYVAQPWRLPTSMFTVAALEWKIMEIEP
jgi:hypothetical protein